MMSRPALGENLTHHAQQRPAGKRLLQERHARAEEAAPHDRLVGSAENQTVTRHCSDLPRGGNLAPEPEDMRQLLISQGPKPHGGATPARGVCSDVIARGHGVLNWTATPAGACKHVRYEAMLHEFVTLHREELIRRCRAKVAVRAVPLPTAAEIDHGVPLFLNQLVDVLRLGTVSSPEIRRTALLHGHDLLLQGFTVSQVVHDYGDVCQSITELAGELRAPIGNDDFRLLNACLDDAITVAVTQLSHERDQTAVDGEDVRQQSAVDGESGRANERLGFLAHELRNLLNTALLACDALKSGKVGIAGSTGAVLRQSLLGAAEVISDSLSDVRVARGIQNRAPFLVSTFLDDLRPAAMLAAEAGGIAFTVVPAEEGVSVDADRQVLASVVMNLLQNAFKFTKPGTRVTLRVSGGAERVLFEVEDGCGGLPGGDGDGLFRPFEQRGANRSGLGLGLPFSRWALEASHGRVYARSLPGVGCIFTVDLPRCDAPALASV